MSLRLHLVSWNVHGTLTTVRVIPRMRAVAREVVRRSPDIALLQEVWTPVQADLIASGLGSDYARIDTPPGGSIGRIAGLLAFVSRASGWRVAGYEFEEFHSSAPAWKVWEGDGLGRKGLLRLDLEREGVRLVVVNTHLQASYSPGGYTEVRRSQLEQLGRSIGTIAAGVPVLVAGDLNVQPSERLYEEISRHFEDLSAPFRERCGCGTSVGSGAWIDYVLVRRAPAWSASAALERIVSVRKDYPYSDHHGLDARVQLTPVASGRLEPRSRAARALWGPSTRRAWLRAAFEIGRRLL
jgi:endonuclease/exonuclease/phosphatase family metal-dependent hydrolase